jgi:ABC-type Fe3+/spermidine/putrescine transport system ATPase subunit
MANVSIQALEKRYSAGGKSVVDDLNLEVEEGEFLTLLGPSG